jgi:hypothetical protein
MNKFTFTPQHTGGGCMALRAQAPHGFILCTIIDDAELPDDLETDDVVIGIYDEDGEEVNCTEFRNGRKGFDSFCSTFLPDTPAGAEALPILDLLGIVAAKLYAIHVPTLNDLIDEYERWNKEQGLNLGSADEHLFDESLTGQQRNWVRNFSDRWEAAEHREANSLTEEQRAEIIATAVARSKIEINADIASGRVPATVASFGELHDYVDANEYGGLCEDSRLAMLILRNDCEMGNAIQNAVDAWIKAGRPS